MSPSQSLTQNRSAVKLLAQNLKNGSLSGNERPAQVHKSSPVFSKTPLKNFRTAYKNTKKRLGISSDSSGLIDDKADINRKCTDENETDIKKRKISANSGDEEFDNDHDFGSELLCEQYTVRPMVAFSVLNEPRTTTSRLIVAIVLPTGIDVTDFSVHVVCSGEFLEFQCLWPKEVVDVQSLHRKWLFAEKEEERIQNYYPKILGFEDFFKKMRKRATDPVQSVCRIPLPFAVETHLQSKTNVQWRNSTTRVAYVELRAAAEEYGIENDAEKFELV